MSLYRLYLTAEERQTLEGWRQKYTLHSPKLRQIQILLNSDEPTAVADGYRVGRRAEHQHQNRRTGAGRAPTRRQTAASKPT